ncbi:MAG: sulfatase-like hydrolase/transferase [Opitutae bacterium]|nr:sulfatase-like hydrolase/transferase [Opitutae bacterium]
MKTLQICLWAVLCHPFFLLANPNIVLILADDATCRDLEVYGGQAKTPHLKALAGEGLKFNHCFQAAAMCSPTRHNLYTGIYPVKSGAYPNHTYVKEGVKSLPHYLKPLGYRVALSGKTHIAPREAFPFEYSTAPSPDGKNAKGNIDFGAVDKLFRECGEAGIPFCLVLGSKEPHTPYNRGNPADYPPESLKLRPFQIDTPETREEFSRYLAEITVFDEEVGEAMRLLKKYGLEEDTVFIALGEQGNGFTHAKWTCYEDGLKSACIIRWPGKIEPGSVTDAVIEYVDLVPTLLEIVGASLPDELDGRSFLPVLLGQANLHKTYVYGLHTTLGIQNNLGPFGIRTVRSPNYRYILNLHPDEPFRCAIERSDWFHSWVAKAEAGDQHARDLLDRHTYRPAEELYDVVNDPDNLVNLAGKERYSGIQAALRARLNAWMRDQGDLGQETELKAPQRLARNRDK